MVLPGSTSWDSLPVLEKRLLDVDIVHADDSLDPGPRKTRNTSVS